MAEASSIARPAGIDISNSFSGTERMFGMATNRVLGFAAALGVGFSLDRIRETVGELAKIGDSADRVGLTVEQFQQLGYAASQAGVDVGTMTDGLRQFVKLVGEAAGGASNDFTRVLAANGVALRDSYGQMRGQRDLLRDCAKLIRNAGNEQDAIRLAVIAFGEEAGMLVNMLPKGGEGHGRMAKSASDLGLVLSSERRQPRLPSLPGLASCEEFQSHNNAFNFVPQLFWATSAANNSDMVCSARQEGTPKIFKNVVSYPRG